MNRARIGPLLAVALLLAASACGQGVPSPSETPTQSAAASAVEAGDCGSDAPPPSSPVYAFFRCEGDESSPPAAFPVPRQAQAADPVSRLQAALIGLLGGPTDEEAARGYVSWFSEETELVPVNVDIDPDALAIVDFGDLTELIPNASTSAGAAALLAELDATVFQFDEVEAVEYRMEGSCERFFEWLQMACEVRARPSS